MKSVMAHKFSNIPDIKIPRSQFDRSHGRKMTFSAGYLVPFYVDEAVPGDTFNMKSTNLVRMISPLNVPMMDNMFLETFFFSVPLRLVWNNFKKMMGEQDNPADSTDYIAPTSTTPGGGVAFDSLHDYMGIRPGVAGIEFNNTFFRAYNLIWNTWFRDQNLQDSVVVDLDDGPDDPADYVLLRRGKRHDYFTSCLPWPQKGVAVDLPIGSYAPITGIGVTGTANPGGTVVETGGGTPTYAAQWSSNDGDGTLLYVEAHPSIGTQPNIYADLSSATAATINDWRQSLQVQTMYEIDARSGTRYTEIVRGHFGVVSPDARQQRPEFLGGGHQRIDVQQVADQAGISNVLGDLAAYGISSGTGSFNTSFTEHCIVIGLVNIRADLTYQQGLDRMFSRSDKLDWYWPSLARIGEQTVFNKEIYVTGTATDDQAFGYQERFGEMRYKNSSIHGQLRSDHGTPLDVYHLSQKFTSVPVLGDAFIQDNPPISRITNVTLGPKFVGDFYNRLLCARPLPIYGVPAGLGRF